MQRIGRLRPQWQQPFLLAFAAQADLSGCSQLQIVPLEPSSFADPGTAVVEEEKQSVVAPAIAGAFVRHVDDLAGVFCLKVGRRPLPRLLRGYGKHTYALL